MWEGDESLVLVLDEWSEHNEATDCDVVMTLARGDNHGSPEDAHQRGVDGVSVVDIHVVPAALGGEVAEAQPERRIRAATQGHGMELRASTSLRDTAIILDTLRKWKRSRVFMSPGSSRQVDKH